MTIKTVTVPLGAVNDVFTKHDVAPAKAAAMITFLVKLWMFNEPPAHEGLTKESIGMLDLDEMVNSLLIVEIIPLLLPIGIMVRESGSNGDISAFTVKPHVIILEYLK